MVPHVNVQGVGVRWQCWQCLTDRLQVAEDGIVYRGGSAIKDTLLQEKRAIRPPPRRLEVGEARAGNAVEKDEGVLEIKRPRREVIHVLAIRGKGYQCLLAKRFALRTHNLGK